nr:molybdate-anion transporter-like [Ciona intestinalis]|eukprot:XP_026690063.1 molybdate-anion transporter-like [Ciona intestinalis]
MLFQLVFFTFIVIGLIALLLEGISRYTAKKTNTNPQFLAFQRIYLLVYVPIIFGDWLNAPYLYKLYSSYGFIEDQIAIIYVCGFASSLFFGASSGFIVQSYGKRKVFVIATLLYAVSCLIKLSSQYSVLIIGRIISGASTSILFCAQEAWYIHEHITVHEFPPEWINYTMLKASKTNSVLAVFAGVLSYCMCELYGLGPVAPSILSVPVLLVAGVFAGMKWKENVESPGKLKKVVIRSNSTTSSTRSEKKKFLKTCCQGLRTIVENSELIEVGFVQALFESVLCLFVFLWTPVLDHHNPPLGIVFASFMAATLVGGAIYRSIRSVWTKLQPAYSLVATMAVTCATVLGCVISTEPSREFPVISFIAFLFFEMASGVYFPVMIDLKRAIELDKLDVAVTTWFRVPLNLIACSGLIFLHSSSNATGTRKLFACCFVTIIIALFISMKLVNSIKTRKSHPVVQTDDDT